MTKYHNKVARYIYIFSLSLNIIYPLKGQAATISDPVKNIPAGVKENKVKEANLEAIPPSGSVRYEKEILPALKFAGKALLSGTTVQGLSEGQGTLAAYEAHLNEVKVMGALRAKRSEMGNATIMGQVELKKCSLKTLTLMGRGELKGCMVKGEASILGFLYGLDSTFEKALVVTGDKVVLVDSHLQDITVKPSEKSQTIRLKGATVVNGSITFERPGGIVRADKGVVIKGAINGGSLEEHPQDHKRTEA